MKRLFLISLFLFLCVQTVPAAPGTVHMLFFYAETCDHCQDVLHNLLPDLMKQYPLEIRFYEVNDPANYEILLQTEKIYKDHDNKDYPIIFFDAYSYASVKEIMQKDMVGTLARVVADGGCQYPRVPPPTDSNATAKSADLTTVSPVLATISVAYFYETGCAKCGRTKQDLNVLAKEYPQLRIREYNIDDAKALNEALCDKYKVPQKYRLTGPAVFIGDHFIHFEQVDYMYDALKERIDQYVATGSKAPWNIKIDTQKITQMVTERFKSIGIIAILLAGLLDGINPCAFATIVFFISYLTLAGRKGREILYVGSAFTSAIFVTYLGVGLGFFKFIKSLDFLPLLSRGIYIFTIIVALIFGLLSFYDYFKYRKGHFGESILKLPNFLRKRLNKVIRKRARTRNFVITAFVTGFLVSLLEFACTGQVYLPTVIFVSKLPGHQMRAVMLMVLYNVAFIIPLIVIFIMAYKGVTSHRLADTWKKNAAMVKIGLGIFFIGLAILLYLYM